jgi:hypothetical protein
MAEKKRKRWERAQILSDLPPRIMNPRGRSL